MKRLKSAIVYPDQGEETGRGKKKSTVLLMSLLARGRGNIE
jgi:hypothetical protein